MVGFHRLRESAHDWIHSPAHGDAGGASLDPLLSDHAGAARSNDDINKLHVHPHHRVHHQERGCSQHRNCNWPGPRNSIVLWDDCAHSGWIRLPGIWPRCSECWCICTGWYCGCVLANHSSWSSSQRCDKGGLSVRIGCDNDGLIVSYNPRACPHSSCIFFKARISDALWKHVIIMRIFVANLVGLVPTSIWCLNFTTYSSFMSR
mmetsp:Transcript_28028/g.53351  ORF Transcript_28028/g.53351 Transcript_28028/m.53351 type:complete len:205 (-) Transcript_28028:97-711(-)